MVFILLGATLRIGEIMCQRWLRVSSDYRLYDKFFIISFTDKADPNPLDTKGPNSVNLASAAKKITYLRSLCLDKDYLRFVDLLEASPKVSNKAHLPCFSKFK